jgi:hypothetical protein
MPLIRIAGLVGAVILGVAMFEPRTITENMGAVFLVLAALALYFLPGIVGYARKHHNAAAILTLNLLAGWTTIGWISAFVWAMTATRPRAPATLN